MTTNAPPSPKPSQSRERNGCLTCRQRKKKCDGIYPICDQCRRLNFTCQREDPRKPRAKPGRPPKARASNSNSKSNDCACSSVSLPQSPSLSSFWLENGSMGVGEGSGDGRRVVMRYYIQSFTTLLTTTLENNCFLSVFLPMSMESPLLLNALVAWSSSHLALRNPAYTPLSISHRLLALQSLSTSLSLPPAERNPEMELASCLIHCAMESITGDTEQWFGHLVGGFSVIWDKGGTGGKLGGGDGGVGWLGKTFEGRWLLRSFAYHDVLMSVVEERRPLIGKGEYWRVGEDVSGGGGGADSYFGLASRILGLVSEISCLNVDMLEDATSSLAKTFSKEARRVQEELVNWNCAESNDGMLVNLAEMYRSAALIHLFRTIRQHRPQFREVVEEKIQVHVRDIVGRVESMKQGCLAESSLLFPLFMMGGEAVEEEHIEVVRDRLRDIGEKRWFGNLERVGEVLEEVWHLRATGAKGVNGERVDWKSVLKRRGWKLSIA